MAVQVEILHEFKPFLEQDAAANKDQVSWCVTADPLTGAPQELCVLGNRVVWLEGLNPGVRTVKKVYSVETDIVQAFWCRFRAKKPRSDRKDGAGEREEWKEREGAKRSEDGLLCICVREQNCLTLFLQTGAVHYVPLPFIVREIWPIRGGLLLARQISPDWGYDGLPTLFTLLHPMDDFCPVTCKRPAATTSEVSVIGFFSSPQMVVVDVSVEEGAGEGMPLLICYDSSTRRHSIWSIQQATRDEIPAHITTPQRPASGPNTPQNPLSSSAPSCYGNQATPLCLMDTPVEMILSNRRQGAPPPSGGHAQGVEPLKLPVLLQLQRQASPWGMLTGSAKSGEGSGHKMQSTGRSPFVSRLQTPQNGASQFVKKRSKSLSPPNLARLSPFSQTVNSRSWSTFYSEELSFGHMFEPLVPQICIHLHWQEQENIQQSSSTSVVHHSATSLFKTSDLIGCHYLAMLIPSLSQLHLLSYDVIKGEVPSFGAITIIHATQVIPLESLSMILILGADKQLMLYSGPHKVAIVTVVHPHMPSPMESSGMEGSADLAPGGGVANIRDGLGDSFMVEQMSGEMFRCSLPLVCRHPVVHLCLEGLKQLLPADTATALLSAYYTSSHCLPYSSLLDHFCGWLSSCLNLDGSKMEEGESSDTGHLASKEPSLQCIQDMVDTRMLNSVPALKLFTSVPTKRHCEMGVASNQAPPTCTSHTVSLEAHREAVVYSLHLVYEEMKTNVLFYDSLFSIGNLLYQIVSSLGWQLYLEHYEREFPSLFLSRSHHNGTHIRSEEDQEEMDEGHMTAPGGVAIPLHPPSLVHWLHQKLRGHQPPPFPVLPTVCKRTTTLLKSYALFTADGTDEPLDLTSCLQVVGGCGQMDSDQFCNLETEAATSSHEKVVLNLVQDGIGLSELESFPVGVALPLWDSIVRCQERPPSSWPPAAYDLIGRVDVVKSLSFSTPTFSPMIESPDDCEDNMNIDNEILKLQFPKDLRVNEVRRLLQSFKPVKIALVQKPEVSDHKFLEEQQKQLLAVSQRTMSLPVGRGMFTLALSQPLPTAPLAIPYFNLHGRVPPRNTHLGLGHIKKPRGFMVWPRFHNGAAAGLKISPHLSQLDSTWVVCNRPSGEIYKDSFAGFLMALGLNGHLSSLHDYNLYSYLHEKHELTVIGLLLGLTASKAGSMSDFLISLLSIYFPPLLPHGSADLEVTHSIQTAALVGIGLLYLGSANRHMVEMALRQIGHVPGPELEFSKDRESYSLAAGFALGMITLGRGGNCVGLSDLHLVDQLCVYMNGGPKSLVAMETASGTNRFVLEGDYVNCHVTAPGAISALGLMYLKTNDSVVAATLDAPGTQYELDCIRPDFLLLRALSRGLIMWDSIQPTQDWINIHIPELVMKHAFQGHKRQDDDYNPTLDYQTLSQALVNITAGCCMAMGLCYAGTRDQSAFKCLLHNAKDLLGKMKSSSAKQAGKSCLEACLDTVVIALSLVMSGSGDLEVLKLIRRLHVRIGHSEVCYGNHMAVHMALGLLFLGGGRYSLSRSNKAIAALVCALYPKFPNSSVDNRYHLQALRHLYVLAAEPRMLVTRDVRTGQACSANVIVRCEDGREGVSSQTPCVVPEWSSIREVEVCSDQYLPIRLDLSSEKTREALSKSGTIFVKKRTSNKNKLSGSSFSTSNYGIGKVKGTIKLPCDELTTDPATRTLCKQFSVQNSSWSQFVSAALLECIHQEKLQALTPYLQLEQSAQSICNNLDGELVVQHLWQIKLAQSYVGNTRHDHTPLVSCDFTEALHMRLRTAQEKATRDSPSLSEDGLNNLLKWHLLQTGTSDQQQQLSRKEAILLLLTLILYDIPPPGVLKLKSSTTVPELYQKLSSQGVPVTAVVRLMPILQSQIPGF